MRQAATYFERAIGSDAGFAPAWAGLADALSLQESYGHAEPGSLLPRALEAADRALEIDPDLAEAHASLGMVHYLRREGPAGIRDLQRAVEVRPTYGEAHNWLSYAHALLGNPSEALASARRAVELNPLSPEAVSNLSLSRLVNDDPGQALVAARRIQELQPDYATGHLYEALSLHALGRFREARGVLQDLSVPWTGPGAEAFRALVSMETGDTDGARDSLSRLQDRGEPFDVGLVRAALGDVDAAFDAFQEIDRWGDWPTLVVRYPFEEALRDVREDPRYPELLLRLDRSWSLDP